MGNGEGGGEFIAVEDGYVGLFCEDLESVDGLQTLH
jgi:hypothetical protein